MTNHLSQALTHWFENKDQTQWVLGTIYKTEKSAYRKAGAMMLIDGFGQQYGLLSGGCLEADIKLNAKRVMQTGKSLLLTYDSQDEDDLAFQIGIGCGGVVHIILQPITAENDLGLSDLREALNNRRGGVYRQLIADKQAPEATFDFNGPLQNFDIAQRSTLETQEGAEWLVTQIRPDPHLLVVGGGPDAMPVVEMAKRMGWYVSLVDPRAANARKEFFASADVIGREMGAELTQYAHESRIDAVVLMAHSVSLDAQALKDLHKVESLKYLALLGPRHRHDTVLDEAGINWQDAIVPISGPAGLDIGGDLPEAIALSILSECHAALHGRTATSLSKTL
jgi:xanthine dehydrogenase accessory factor